MARPKTNLPTMHPSVRNYIAKFLGNPKIEGKTPYMYLDKIGAVTTDIGVKIDSPDEANEFDWIRIKDGEEVDEDEVTREWHRIKDLYKDPKWRALLPPKENEPKRHGPTGTGVFIEAAKKAGKITLKLQDIMASFKYRLDQEERWMLTAMGKDFQSNYGAFPADAQLGLLTIVWGVGHNAMRYWNQFKPLRASLRKQPYPDWFKISVNKEYHFKMREDRDRALQLLFHNAWVVEEVTRKEPPSRDIHREVLYYPNYLMPVYEEDIRG